MASYNRKICMLKQQKEQKKISYAALRSMKQIKHFLVHLYYFISFLNDEYDHEILKNFLIYFFFEQWSNIRKK